MSDLPKLLIVEDDEAIRTQLKYALRERYALWFADSRLRALALVNEVHPDLVSLDLGLPPHPDTVEEGLSTLEDILRAAPGTKVIVLTGSGDRTNARRAIELGAFDYLSKSADLAEYEMVLRRSTYLQTLESETARETAEAEAGARFEEIIGSTPRMGEIFSMVSLVAKTDVTVLIQGESGTGKELVAAAIHRISSRAKRPFIPVNCSAIPQDLLESEFFGHVRGAFSGAVADALGLFRGADEGTIFLDEIAELSPALQVKLLRVLQEMQVRPVGSTKAYPVDVRVIAATNRDLERAMTEGAFRQDLFYRLNVVRITLPPLRERRDDISALVTHFLRRFNRRFHREVRGIAPDALAALSAYSFPGNVRELENLIERAYAMGARDQITLGDLPSLGRTPVMAPVAAAAASASNQPVPTLADVERELILKALAVFKDDKEAAARALGISRRTIYRRLKEYGVL